jgi:hypothetical protein
VADEDARRAAEGFDQLRNIAGNERNAVIVDVAWLG